MLPQNRSTLSKFLLNNRILNFCRSKSSRVAGPVFLEKGNEEPVITIPRDRVDLLKDEVDLIGPADPISNLRPIIRRRNVLESALQEQLRKMQDSAHEWNQNFWSNHNTKFAKEKLAFINSRQTVGGERRQLTAEEMSEFYKKFLDEHWRTHVDYNFEWYKRNFSLLFLSLKVRIEKTLGRIV